MNTVSLLLALPDGSQSRLIHIWVDGEKAIRMATSNVKQGTPLPDDEAHAIAEVLTRTIEGAIAIVKPWKPPTIFNEPE